jgi:hypothetical protein
MSDLNSDLPRAYELGNENSVPIAANTRVYEGMAISVGADGYGKPLSAGERFIGFALQRCENANGQAGEKNIRILGKGAVVLNVPGLTANDVAKAVYATADNSFTLTKAANSRIGVVKRYIEDGLAVVEFYLRPV